MLQHDRLILLHKAVALVERETGRRRVEQEGGTLAGVRPVEALFKGSDIGLLYRVPLSDHARQGPIF